MAADLPKPTQHPAPAGFPATLFGLTPADWAYWREPGLPWLRDVRQAGLEVEITTTGMAPRFPKGCRVAIAPVTAQQLHIGRVYVFITADETGPRGQVGRLADADGDYAQATLDNDPTSLLWCLSHGQLYEVTHYLCIPGEDEELPALPKSVIVSEQATDQNSSLTALAVRRAYIDLLTHFWELDALHCFSSSATRLYMFLLRSSDQQQWVDRFDLSDKSLVGQIGGSINTWKKARTELIERGLVQFQAGGNGRNDCGEYALRV